MEELRSTEILDKEIQVSARKKAERILAKADEDCKSLESQVAERVEKAKNEVEALFAHKLEAIKKDSEASIPLEKQRLLVSFIQNEIVTNINDYLVALGEDKRIELVLKNAGEVLPRLSEGTKVNAFVYGFDSKKAEKALKKLLATNLSKVEETVFGKAALEESAIDLKEGIILVSEDSKLKMRFTLCEVVNAVLDKYREEMKDALFGDVFGSVK
ncbi:MAG: hypothetical protein MJ176_08555 [Treponema sp.]|nr:hypothetical protein [Treponema sp.]